MGHKERYRLVFGLSQLNKYRFMDYKQSLFFGEVRRPYIKINVRWFLYYCGGLRRKRGTALFLIDSFNSILSNHARLFI